MLLASLLGLASVRGKGSMGLVTIALALVISILLAGVLFKATRICDNWTKKGKRERAPSYSPDVADPTGIGRLTSRGGLGRLS